MAHAREDRKRAANRAEEEDGRASKRMDSLMLLAELAAEDSNPAPGAVSNSISYEHVRGVCGPSKADTETPAPEVSLQQWAPESRTASHPFACPSSDYPDCEDTATSDGGSDSSTGTAAGAAALRSTGSSTHLSAAAAAADAEPTTSDDSSQGVEPSAATAAASFGGFGGGDGFDGAVLVSSSGAPTGLGGAAAAAPGGGSFGGFRPCAAAFRGFWPAARAPAAAAAKQRELPSPAWMAPRGGAAAAVVGAL